MGGKRGRPRKERLECSIELSVEEKEEIKGAMLQALRGTGVGDMEPLTSKAYVDLVMFALGEKRDKGESSSGGIGKEEDYGIASG